jgi:hypothetical protein
MKALALIALVTLAGCQNDQSEDWGQAAGRYQCTDAQMQKVAGETLFCKKEAEYSSTYCYSTAIMRNCVPKRRESVQAAASQEGT